ncbi:MAG: signal peptidase II [Actinomycetota bacterium]|nr:signal peptidase II [Actinomycetota bacterium]
MTRNPRPDLTGRATGGRERRTPSLDPLRIGLLVGAIGWVLDQATKAVVVNTLALGETVPLPGPLFLQLTFNEGAAFGLPVPWWVFPIVAAVVVTLVVRNLPRAESLLDPFAYGLLLAGALGNVTDRLLRPNLAGFGRGEVVDFIASSFWPTFNLADVFITVGFVLLLAAAFRQEQANRRRGAVEPSSHDPKTVLSVPPRPQASFEDQVGGVPPGGPGIGPRGGPRAGPGVGPRGGPRGGP